MLGPPSRVKVIGPLKIPHGKDTEYQCDVDGGLSGVDISWLVHNQDGKIIETGKTPTMTLTATDRDKKLIVTCKADNSVGHKNNTLITTILCKLRRRNMIKNYLGCYRSSNFPQNKKPRYYAFK